jgi:hypothetical protein
MNDRDVLERASRALRENTEPTPAELAALRARVLSGQVTPLAPRARSKTLRWLLPLAAALITGSALAATPGAWQGLVEAVERYLPVELLSPAREAARPVRRGAKQPPAPPPLPSAPAPAAPAEPPAEPAPAQAQNAPEPEVSPRQVTPAAAPRPVSAARAGSAHGDPPAPSAAPAELPAAPEPGAEEAVAAPARASSAELALYRPAHELHFRARDYAAALDAWDAYLSRFPAGTLALEAEYNRALCLMRLGRYAEARTALAPFAAGARAGGYRRSEAARFLQALEKAP